MVRGGKRTVVSREGCGNEEEEGGQWCRGKDNGEEGKGGSVDEKKEYSGDEGKENRGEEDSDDDGK